MHTSKLLHYFVKFWRKLNLEFCKMSNDGENRSSLSNMNCKPTVIEGDDNNAGEGLEFIQTYTASLLLKSIYKLK